MGITARNITINGKIVGKDFVPSPPVADFTGTPILGDYPLTVNFTDTSTNNPTSWLWDFKNDGTATSTQQNPSYTYSSAGTYTVKLTATNSGGSNTVIKTSYITVARTPVANFTGTPTSGDYPLTVNFTDSSTNSPTSWLWDFKNDGTATSTQQNPSYTYTSDGTYSVKLTASNAAGSNSITRTSYISVSAPVVTPTTIDLLVVGGGGSSANGGGGAGGLLYGTYTVVANTTYTVTVGAGGTPTVSGEGAGQYLRGSNGNNSVFGVATANGGGAGGSTWQPAAGAAGGSGGGACGATPVAPGAGTKNQGNVTNQPGMTGFGNNGGSGQSASSANSGGGGGAGATGTNATTVSGSGGIGLQYDISGTTRYYAGGGGGSYRQGYSGAVGAGGLGGGATGTVLQISAPSTNGAANTGGGAGGMGFNNNYSAQPSGASYARGGSGVVILRYSSALQAATSTTGNPTVTVSGGYRIYTFTQSGSITF